MWWERHGAQCVAHIAQTLVKYGLQKPQTLLLYMNSKSLFFMPARRFVKYVY